jgi:hypothetical protein
MKEKKCFKCGEVKPLSEFYKHPQMSDGHVNKCKDCNKRDVRKNRKDKVDYYRAYDRERGNRQGIDYLRKYRAENPEKYRAHSILNKAVSRGKIHKQPCEICGTTERIEAHHEDYSKPLDVIWLCSMHHSWIHG